MEQTPVHGNLRVEFLGQAITVGDEVGDELTFGRDADLVIDEANRFMHRCTGAFRLKAGQWWLHNLAREAPMVLFGANGMRSVLPAGTRTALSAARGVVTFQAGPSPYEITFILQTASEHTGALSPSGEQTATFQLQLTSQQLEVLSEFARPGFQNVAAPTPTYAEVGRRLDMRPKAIDLSLIHI